MRAADTAKKRSGLCKDGRAKNQPQRSEDDDFEPVAAKRVRAIVVEEHLRGGKLRCLVCEILRYRTGLVLDAQFLY